MDELVEIMAEAMGAPIEGDEWGEYPPFKNYARRALYGRPIWIDRWWGVNFDGTQVVNPCWEVAGHHNPPASLIGWMPLPNPARPEGA